MPESAWIALGALIFAFASAAVSFAYAYGQTKTEGRATRTHIDTVVAHLASREDLEAVRGTVRVHDSKLEDHGRRLDVVEKRVRSVELQEA